MLNGDNVGDGDHYHIAEQHFVRNYGHFGPFVVVLIVILAARRVNVATNNLSGNTCVYMVGAEETHC